VPIDPVSPDVLLQLLVCLCRTDNRSCLEAGQLSRTAAGWSVLADAVAVHVDRGAGHAVFAATGISAGLLLVVSRRKVEGFVVPARYYSIVGQLPGSCLCVEDDPGKRWR